MSRLGKIDPNSYAEPGKSLFGLVNLIFSNLQFTNNINSFNIEKVIIKHIDLFWNINFTNQTISGKAIYKLKVQSTEIDKIVSIICLMEEIRILLFIFLFSYWMSWI